VYRLVVVPSSTGAASALAPRHRLLRRGLWLEYVTLAWNLVGVGVLGVAALAAHSVALAGFGLDSLIEILASTVVIWQLTDTGGQRQRTAMRLIGGAFFALALYIAVQGAYALVTGGGPAPSPLGVAWTAITCVVMLALAFAKARTGAALGNPVLMTEGRVTLIDAYLAGAVLLGLLLNAALGWWWADPLAGFVIVFYGLKEGWEALHDQPDGASVLPG
jgi:divalent metal cation (Fe/Co/Zn/Cd) transporter